MEKKEKDKSKLRFNKKKNKYNPDAGHSLEAEELKPANKKAKKIKVQKMDWRDLLMEEEDLRLNDS